MKWVIGILLVLAFFGNSPLMQYQFPKMSEDYDQFVGAYYFRNKFYECIFCLCFYGLMISNKGFTRAVFAFGFVVCAASCFDKIILNVSQYLWTDILVIIVAFGCAYYGYKREKNAGQG